MTVVVKMLIIQVPRVLVVLQEDVFGIVPTELKVLEVSFGLDVCWLGSASQREDEAGVI